MDGLISVLVALWTGVVSYPLLVSFEVLWSEVVDLYV